MRALKRWLVVAALAGAVLSVPRAARACATCAAGDPTLYAMGSEKSFEGRIRAALAFRAGDAWEGEPGIDALTIKEQRLELDVVVSPWKDIAISADMPLLHRNVLLDHGPSAAAVLPGDLELRVRDATWSSHEGRIRQALAFHAGVKLPTGPLERDGRGVLLPADLEPGCSAITPLAGLSYALSRAPYTFTAAATLYLPFGVRSDAPHTGDGIRTQMAFQVEPRYWIAGRLGFDTKLDEPATNANSVVDPNSGGFVGYVASELVFVLKTDWQMTVGGYFPAIQDLRGKHGEGPVGSVSLVVDF